MLARTLFGIVDFAARKGLASRSRRNACMLVFAQRRLSDGRATLDRWRRAAANGARRGTRQRRKAPECAAHGEAIVRARRIEAEPYRFDVLAIETRVGVRPEVRLHKGAYNG